MIAYSLNIGLTNRCNASCFFCPVKNTQIERTDMPFELAEKVISESQVSHHVSLALFGESTLYSRLADVVRLVKKKRLMAILYTNGIVLNKTMADELSLAGLDKVIFSIDAFDASDYKHFKGIDKYEQVINNCLYFGSLRKTKVIAQFADLHYSTPKEIISEKLKILRKAVDVKLGRFITWGGHIDWQGMTHRKIRQNKPCLHIFKFINIASNGDMVMCCMDYNHSVKIGNVKNRNVMDVWNGEKFNEIRTLQKGGFFNPLCLGCENESYYST